MKAKITLLTLISIFLLSFIGGKELLVDIIATHDKIPVIISPDSKTTRSPLIEGASDKKRNYMPLPEDLKKKTAETIVAGLNKGFKTEAFYLKSLKETMRDEFAQENDFFVSLTLKATYYISSDATTGNAQAKLNFNSYSEFYEAKGGKAKRVNGGPGGMSADCKDYSSIAATYAGVNGLLIQLKTHCVEEPALKIIEKKLAKFCQKQIAKAEKAKK